MHGMSGAQLSGAQQQERQAAGAGQACPGLVHARDIIRDLWFEQQQTGQKGFTKGRSRSNQVAGTSYGSAGPMYVHDSKGWVCSTLRGNRSKQDRQLALAWAVLVGSMKSGWERVAWGQSVRALRKFLSREDWVELQQTTPRSVFTTPAGATLGAALGHLKQKHVGTRAHAPVERLLHGLDLIAQPESRRLVHAFTYEDEERKGRSFTSCSSAFQGGKEAGPPPWARLHPIGTLGSPAPYRHLGLPCTL
eukprot:1150944-Pelagomonas_calceolata.AAC.2